MATGGAEMEAVDQSQVMPELGVRRGPEGSPLEGAELSNREMNWEEGRVTPRASLSSLSLCPPQTTEKAILALHDLLSRVRVWPSQQVWLWTVPFPLRPLVNLGTTWPCSQPVDQKAYGGPNNGQGHVSSWSRPQKARDLHPRAPGHTGQVGQPKCLASGPSARQGAP